MSRPMSMMPKSSPDLAARSGWGITLTNAAVSAGVVFLAAVVGSVATASSIPTWYAGLVKPSFTPPNWVFGPAWTILYILITIAFWRVLQTPAGTPGRGLAIKIFLAQITLNALWSVVFFGMRSPEAGMVVVIALEASILATIWSFARLDRIAAWLLAPYPFWVAFATALNAGILILNR